MDWLPYPAGLLHYVYNPTCYNASLMQIWNNADFGTVIAYANMVNNFPEEALQAITGLDSVSPICLAFCSDLQNIAPYNKSKVDAERSSGVVIVLSLA